MNQFTIKDIENLCGIKAHTLRIWEQRYRLCVAKRKESLHRIYDNDDLKELLRISFLYHSGHKISRIAELTSEEIDALVQQACITPQNYEVFVHQLVEAGVDFDKEKFEKVINCLLLRIGMEKCITDVFYPFLERIGLLWMTNNVIPAQEHFASHIIRKKIILAIDGITESHHQARGNIVVFAPPGEFHEIPLLTANYFFRKHNHHTTYFGTNVAVESLQYYGQVHAVTAFYAHLITRLDKERMEIYVQTLERDFPGVPILLSGPASRCIADSASITKLHSLSELMQYAAASGAAI